MEAIIAGTPVLVSSESGLGAMLRETLDLEWSERIVIPMSLEFEKDAERWAAALESMLLNRDEAFRRAQQIRQYLSREKRWATSINPFLIELSEISVPHDANS